MIRFSETDQRYVTNGRCPDDNNTPAAFTYLVAKGMIVLNSRDSSRLINARHRAERIERERRVKQRKLAAADYSGDIIAEGSRHFATSDKYDVLCYIRLEIIPVITRNSFAYVSSYARFFFFIKLPLLLAIRYHHAS